MSPKRERHIQYAVIIESPLVASYCIERLIVEYGHELGLTWLTLAVRNVHRPLFLLAWHHLVAERAPGEIQLLVREGTLYLYLLAVMFSILYPGIRHSDAVAPLWLIGEGLGNRVGIKMQHSILYHLILRHHDIWGIYILEIAAYGYRYRSIIRGEVFGRPRKPTMFVAFLFLPWRLVAFVQRNTHAALLAFP